MCVHACFIRSINTEVERQENALELLFFFGIFVVTLHFSTASTAHHTAHTH